MALFSKESLEQLRDRIDLVEVISSHIELKSAGATYKALCPFHDEKSPSFVVRRGDSHYHCFGCGAHGDAIAFLMNHASLAFSDAVESLAERFSIHLEKTEGEQKGPSKSLLKEPLKEASALFHFCLLHTEEGREALNYLFARGLDMEFISLFEVGLAPRSPHFFDKTMKEGGFDDQLLKEIGLITFSQDGRRRIFFQDRITFPIRDALGAVIGFSARKMREETFGPKYINTSETPLFKKSTTLFGLSYSRKEIAKQKKAIVVEGQIDALRLIQAGFPYAVAGQGTAFGEGHVFQLIKLGVSHIYLALDGDKAGYEASVKIGNLFQKEGVEVSVLQMSEGSDPDTLLREEGPPGFIALLETAQDYLAFLIDYYSKTVDMNSPSGKSNLVQTLASRIREWDHPLMVHESLRKLARLTHVPEKLVGVAGEMASSNVIIKTSGSLSSMEIDPDRILDIDLLRWLFLAGDRVVDLVKINLTEDHFKTPLCKELFTLFLEQLEIGKQLDLLSVAEKLEHAEEHLLLTEIVKKRVNIERACEGVTDTIIKMLERHWMGKREEIRLKIQSGTLVEAEVTKLAREFDELKSNPPLLQKEAT